MYSTHYSLELVFDLHKLTLGVNWLSTELAFILDSLCLHICRILLLNYFITTFDFQVLHFFCYIPGKPSGNRVGFHLLCLPVLLHTRAEPHPTPPLGRVQKVKKRPSIAAKETYYRRKRVFLTQNTCMYACMHVYNVYTCMYVGNTRIYIHTVIPERRTMPDRSTYVCIIRMYILHVHMCIYVYIYIYSHT